MQFLTCSSDAVPCPVELQQWRTVAEVIDPAALGITPELMVKVYGFGFGATFMMFVIGFVVAVAVGLVRKV
ncbi:MAG: hypothetical protein WKG52_00270 [Variovorax sp.]